MPSIDVLNEKINNLEQRVESHDERYSQAFAKLETEIAVLKGEVVDQKIFKAQLVALAAAGSVMGSLIFALGKALLTRG